MIAEKIRTITDIQRKSLWAAAHAHGLDEEALYSVIASVSGKEHMKELTYVEAAKALDWINHNRIEEAVHNQKRTDEGGDPRTVELREKIYRLTEKLGWNDNNNRINGFVKKHFKIERIEWLDVKQCSKLIEMLKKIVIRQGGKL